jgi:hypothetical protein
LDIGFSEIQTWLAVKKPFVALYEVSCVKCTAQTLTSDFGEALETV